ncbi:MAG: T9SS type A sorting domain-containing protein [Flavobacteriales bacterium]
MRKLFTSIAISFAATTLLAQDNPYFELFVSQSTYVPLTNTTSLNEGVVWDDPNWEVPIGFSFEYLGYHYDSLIFYGYDAYGAELLFRNSTVGYPDCQMSAYMMDLIDSEYDNNGKAASDIRYSLEGAEGSRIFKLEWSNAAFYNDDIEFTNYSMRINFQVWLFEQDGAIEFHYGPSTNLNNDVIQDYEGIPVTFIRNYVETPEYGWEGAYMLTGDPMNPDWIYAATASEFDNSIFLSDTPVDGTVYRFMPVLVNVDEENAELVLEMYPNPASNILTLWTPTKEKAKTQIYDATGRIVESVILNDSATQIDVSSWAPGVYQVVMLCNNQSSVQKLIVQ